MGAKIVGIKCGERGFYLRTAGRQRLNELRTARPADLDGWADREAWEASCHVEHFAGATGSGDSAIAGFLAAYLYGCSFEQTLRAACAVGALNVTAPDALSGLKSWDETLALVKAGWQKNSLEVSSPGWQPGADLLWHGPFDRKAG
jgi:sugar/nucleoside kinase (ribokinase family)